MGAMAEIGWVNRRRIPEGSWLARMLDRKPRKPVAVSLANKIAVMVLGADDEEGGLSESRDGYCLIGRNKSG